MRISRIEVHTVTLAKDDKDAAHWDALKKTGFWGQRGAGCLFLAKDTGRILFAHRSKHVQSPNTWGTWGGAVDGNENPAKACRREVREESGYEGKFDLKALAVFSHPTGFKYFNYLAIVDSEFEPELDWETRGYKWVNFGEWPKPLHSGAKYLIDKSGHEIAELIKQVATAS